MMITRRLAADCSAEACHLCGCAVGVVAEADNRSPEVGVLEGTGIYPLERDAIVCAACLAQPHEQLTERLRERVEALREGSGEDLERAQRLERQLS